MKQPVNYSFGTTNPSQSLLEGFKGGYGISSALRQNQDMKQQAQQREEQQRQFSEAWEKAIQPDATAQDIANAVMLANPEKTKFLQEQLNLMTSDRRREIAGQAGGVYMAVKSGNKKLAKKLIEDLAEASSNAGKVDMANFYNTLAASVEINPEYASDVALQFLANSAEGMEALEKIVSIESQRNKVKAEDAQVSPEIYKQIRDKAIRPDGSFDPVEGYRILSENNVPKKEQDSIIKSLNAGYPASQRASQEVIDLLETPPGKKQSENRQEISQEVFTKIPNFDRMEKLLDAGGFEGVKMKGGKVMTGPFAESRLFAAKIANAVGLPTPTSAEDIAATEAYLASSVQATANIVKQFGAGTGISDKDREFAAKASGGEISMSREALQSIVGAAKMAIVNKAIAHNANVSKVARNTPGATGEAYFDMQAFTEDEFPPEMAALLKEAGAFNMNVRALNKEEGDRIRAIIDSKSAASPQPTGQQESGIPLITTQQDFDNLPSGTLYKEEDGKTYRKP